MDSKVSEPLLGVTTNYLDHHGIHLLSAFESPYTPLFLLQTVLMDSRTNLETNYCFRCWEKTMEKCQSVPRVLLFSLITSCAGSQLNQSWAWGGSGAA